MAHTLWRFRNPYADNYAPNKHGGYYGAPDDGEFYTTAHLGKMGSNSEFTACGMAYDCAPLKKETTVKRGGITCPECLKVIREYKNIKL